MIESESEIRVLFLRRPKQTNRKTNLKRCKRCIYQITFK